MKKQYALFTLLYLLLVFNIDAQNWQSSLVQYDVNTGQLTYKPEPVSGISIPDFSVAGYQGGGVPLPNVAVKKTISPISGDNTAHIQSAIDQVSNLPLNAEGFRGVVLLNPGIYNVRGIIYISTSGVVLRGSGPWNDVATNTHIIGTGNTPANRSIIIMGGGNNNKFSSMVPETKTNIISEEVKAGSKKFKVEDASKFNIGDNIIIYHPCTQKWLDAIDGGGTSSDEKWKEGSQPLIFNTRITSINDGYITINSPVFNTLTRSLSQSYIYKYDRKGLISNIGLENLRVDVEYDKSDLNDENHAANCVHIIQAENSWVTKCKFLHFWYAGVDVETANYITISDCDAFSPIGKTTGGRKYNFCVSSAAQNTLFTECQATKARHAFVSNGTSTVAGIVFHKCKSIDPFTTSEGHRRWSMGMLYDQLKDEGNNPGRVLALANRGSYGTGHGWSNANSVAWNCDVTRPGSDGIITVQRPPTAQNFAIGCKGIVNGEGPFSQPTGYIEGTNKSGTLQPASLYDAQLNFRLNYLIWNFKKDLEGWNLARSLTGVIDNGLLKTEITGDDPYMYSPNNLNASASIYKYIVLRANNYSTSTEGQLFFITSADNVWNENKSIKFNLLSNNAGYTDYIIDLSQHPEWKGTISQLRLDPITGDNGKFNIDKISFEQTVNRAPTDITLSSTSVKENEPVGTVVGVFSTIDPDNGNTFTYTLEEAGTNNDKAFFTIDGNMLKTKAVFNYDTQSNYRIKVRSTDQGGLYDEKWFDYIQVIKNPITGLNKLEDEAINLFPNPVQNALNISLDASNSKYTVQIINPLGIEIVNRTIYESTIFNTENWTKGLYIVKILNGSYVHTSKIEVIK